ncbi:MAG TPA: heparinase II/III family protein, partial [Mycobacteriales bacterium]|nr:heparinase II/III family protein [Mycobacteriales bacterium]
EIERSPLYHFYIFDFAIQLQDWATRSGVTLPAGFTDRVRSMVRYSTDVLWPNGFTPLIGSSVRQRPAGDGPLYAALESTYPQFAYAVTGGRRGSPPTERAALFATSGQVILRSALAAGLPYVDNAQLVLNDGPASTPHSHLDALAIDYYSGGRVLLPDSGLGTYNPGTAFTFFHGTSAQNAVVVDGKDQGPGKVSTGLVQAGPGWEYASGLAQLNAGVSARRSVLMLGENLVLVADSLTSAASHDYQQLWHLFPGAHLTMTGTAAQVSNGQDQPVLQIVQNQLGSAPGVQTYYGAMNPMQGWYSEVYGLLQKNHVIGYSARGTQVTYLTLLAAGPDAANPAQLTGSAGAAGIHLHLCAADGSADITIAHQAAAGETVTVSNGPGGCSHGG